MKKFALTTIALSLMVGCTSTQEQTDNQQASTQAPVQKLTDNDRKKAKNDDRGHRAMPMTAERLERLLKEYNTNGDEQVSWEEYNDWRFARFSETDANNSGFVDADEYLYEFENRLDKRYDEGRKAHVKQTHQRFTALDKNESNAIEWAEIEASGNRIFTHWDTNQDGIIDSSDKKETKAKKRPRSRSNNPINFVRMPTTHSLKGVLSMYDTDKSESVSKDEFVTARRATFDLTDTNKDGSLSSSEYLAEFEDRVDRTIDKSRRAQVKQTHVRFNILDDNKDKQMTFDEFQLSGKRIFTRWDKNEDGVISTADIGK